MSEKPKRGPGRPPSRTGTMEPLRVTITPADMQALDAYCEQNKIGRTVMIYNDAGANHQGEVAALVAGFAKPTPVRKRARKSG